MTQNPVLQTSADRLTFDSELGRLISLQPLCAPGVELVASGREHPVFVVQYLDESGRFAQLDSHSSDSCADPRL